eukprot:1144749-Pelagomonas_calceolata.AAC.1
MECDPTLSSPDRVLLIPSSDSLRFITVETQPTASGGKYDTWLWVLDNECNAEANYTHVVIENDDKSPDSVLSLVEFYAEATKGQAIQCDAGCMLCFLLHFSAANCDHFHLLCPPDYYIVIDGHHDCGPVQVSLIANESSKDPLPNPPPPPLVLGNGIKECIQ